MTEKKIRIGNEEFTVLGSMQEIMAEVRRSNSTAYLNLTDYVECKDVLIARYVEVYLKSKERELRDVKDLRAEVCKILIPRQRQQLQKVMDQYESAQKELEEIPEKIKALEREIDKMVYKLYGLTEEDTKVIEESLAATS